VTVRISKGQFELARAAEVEEALRKSEASLRPAISRLAGMLQYYAGIDRAAGSMTNTSLWDTLEHAQQMSSLPEMLALRGVLEEMGVRFEPITNHAVFWTLP
jgi:hypothetical protein